MADAIGLDEEGRSRKAHAKTGCVYARNPGYHLRKTSSQSPLSTRVRICSNRWAPRWLQRICCLFTIVGDERLIAIDERVEFLYRLAQLADLAIIALP